MKQFWKYIFALYLASFVIEFGITLIDLFLFNYFPKTWFLDVIFLILTIITGYKFLTAKEEL